jgi:MFS family permease
LAALLLWCGLEDRSIFALAAVPGGIAMLLLWAAVREVPHAKANPVAHPAHAEGTRMRPLLPFLAVVIFGAFGTGIDLFLIARAIDLGVPRMQLPLLCAVLHVVRASLSAPFGSWSDRLGRRKVIAFGLASHSLVMVGFGYATEAVWLWPLFALHGLHAAFTEGAERGYVADLTGAGRRGTVFGVYHAVQGLAAFSAPLCLGAVWDARGPVWAFGVGAASQALALVLLWTVVPSSRHR